MSSAHFKLTKIEFSLGKSRVLHRKSGVYSTDGDAARIAENLCGQEGWRRLVLASFCYVEAGSTVVTVSEV